MAKLEKRTPRSAARAGDAAAELDAAVAASGGADAGERDTVEAGAGKKEKQVKYRVLDHGAVISLEKQSGKQIVVEDTRFPLEDKKGDDAWLITMTPSQARRHTDKGVRLEAVNPEHDPQGAELQSAESG